MYYTVYPPQEVDSVLTARVAVLHLGDHLRAFLNANNISNWAPDDDYILRDDRVADVLVSVGTAKGMTIAQIKYRAKKIVRVVRAAGGMMKLSFAYRLIANCLGFSDYTLAYKCRSIDHYVENLWPLGMVINGCLFNDVDLASWPSSSVSTRMRENIKFNQVRDRVVNEVRRKNKKERSVKEIEFLKMRNNALTRGATVPFETRD